MCSDERDATWYWRYGEHNLPMDPADPTDEIRFRVTAVQFPAQTQRRNFGPNADQESDALPMQILATVNEPGLGMLSWWTNTEAAANGDAPQGDDQD